MCIQVVIYVCDQSVVPACAKQLYYMCVCVLTCSVCLSWVLCVLCCSFVAVCCCVWYGVLLLCVEC